MCPPTPPLHAIIATSAETAAHAYHVRYLAYRALGTIPDDPQQQFKDGFDDAPHSRLILVRAGAKPVATMRMLLARSPQDATAGEIFAPELSALHDSKGLLLEATRLAVHPAFRVSIAPVLAIWEHVVQTAIAESVAYIVAPVRAPQLRRYERILGLRVLTPERHSPRQGVSLCLMGAPSSTIVEALRQRGRQRTPLGQEGLRNP